MSLFREDIIENSISERELCLMDPYYFISKYVMISPKTNKEALSFLENACVRMNMTEDEYKQIITKFVRSLW